MDKILKELGNYCKKNGVEAKSENLNTCLELFEREERRNTIKIRNIFFRTITLVIWSIGGIVKRI